MKLRGDASFWRDAGDGAFAVFLVDHLAAETQAAVNSSNHGQYCHEAANPGTLRIGEILLQETLNLGGGKCARQN